MSDDTDFQKTNFCHKAMKRSLCISRYSSLDFCQ